MAPSSREGKASVASPARGAHATGAGGHGTPGGRSLAEVVHALQQRAGNQVVGRVLAGAGGPPPPSVQHHTAGGGDAFEHEAEKVADAVVGGGGGGHRGGGARRPPGGEPGFVGRLAALGGGRPLDGAARGFLEPRFGVDLGHVRLHDGPGAAALAREEGARALTHRHHVVLGARAPRQGAAGMHLLSHEITHTFQQGAPLRGLGGQAAPSVRRTAPTVQRIEEETDVTGSFQEAKKVRVRARNVLEDLENRRFGEALERFRDADLAYHKAGGLAHQKWVKWFRGVSGDFNKARSDAKALYEKPAEEKAEPGHVEAVVKVAAAGHKASEVDHFWVTNYEHSAEMAQKTAWYLIHALPEGALHDAIRERALGTGSQGQEHPIAVLMMGGAGSGKSVVRALGTVNIGDMVVADADAVKELLPSYRKMVQAGVKDAAHKHHAKSQDVTTAVVTTAIREKRHLLYDATGANRGTYLGGWGGIFGSDGLFKLLKQEGYEIRLVMTYVPEEIALERARKRAEATGRHVPDSVVTDTHQTARRHFIEFARDSRVDDAFLYENMASAPVLVWKKSDAQQIDNKEIVRIQQHLGDLDEQAYKHKTGYTSDLRYISSTSAYSDAERLRSDNGTVGTLARRHALTAGEMAAIKLYTASDYQYMNPALANDMDWMSSQFSRASTPADQQVAREEGWLHARFAIRGLKKLPAHSGTTWRGGGFTAEQLATLYPVDGIVTMPAFTSTSLDRSTAERFATREGRHPKLAVLFEVRGRTGREVASFSQMAREREILVLPYTRFRVVSQRRQRGVQVIRLDELE